MAAPATEDEFIRELPECLRAKRGNVLLPHTFFAVIYRIETGGACLSCGYSQISCRGK
jgi:hypothetical protein